MKSSPNPAPQSSECYIAQIPAQLRNLRKLLKDYLCVHEGFVCESPRSCIRTAFKVGLMDEEETMQSLEMIDKKEEIRHVTEQVNFEEVTEEIYRQVGDYWKLMDEVFRSVVKRVEAES